jgi:hypothetical protein
MENVVLVVAIARTLRRLSAHHARSFKLAARMPLQFKSHTASGEVSQKMTAQ